MFERVLITSGPTREPIDPVRYISNRSSGKTGAALAEEALKRGVKQVVFITGPAVAVPSSGMVVHVETAGQMFDHVKTRAPDCDVIIMAAAVSDYRPVTVQREKVKKSGHRMILELERTPDILRMLGKKRSPGQILVGFAAETGNALEHARRKMIDKRLDLIVVNEISETNPAFDVDVNQVTILDADTVTHLEPLPKREIAGILWDRIAQLKQKSLKGEGA